MNNDGGVTSVDAGSGELAQRRWWLTERRQHAVVAGGEMERQRIWTAPEHRDTDKPFPKPLVCTKEFLW